MSIETSAVRQGYTTGAGKNHLWYLLLETRTCITVIPAIPVTAHSNQSGNEAPNKTTEGAGEHPARVNTRAGKKYSFALKRVKQRGKLFIIHISLIVLVKNGKLENLF